MGKTSTASKNKWNSENYERVSLSIKKGTKEQLQKVAEENATSLNGYIKEAVRIQYRKDTGEDIEL